MPNSKASQSQHETWTELYAHNSVRVRKFVSRLVGSSGPASAEDLTQEVFVVAFANWKRFRRSSSPSTWLCGIAFNLARRHLSREASASRALNQLSADVLGSGHALAPETLHLCREQENALFDAAEELPSKLQDAFVLHCLSGLSAQEAAAELGVSEGNLRVRVARARALVKARIGAGRG